MSITIETKEGQTVALSVFEKSTGSAIDIICEDLAKTESGILVRMDDYIIYLQEQLKAAGEYSYSCGEVSTETIKRIAREKLNLRDPDDLVYANDLPG